MIIAFHVRRMLETLQATFTHLARQRLSPREAPTQELQRLTVTTRAGGAIAAMVSESLLRMPAFVLRAQMKARLFTISMAANATGAPPFRRL